MKKIVFIFFSNILILLIFIFVGEIFCRVILNQKPYKAIYSYIKIFPGGKFYKKDSLLGYTQLKGKYRIWLRRGYTFNVNNTTDISRKQINL
jgi:hypothetical protein